MLAYSYPGLYLEELQNVPRKELPTAVPVFLGYVRGTQAQACSLTSWSQFEMRLGEPVEKSYLASAVRGFFENGGKLCYVVPLESSADSEKALVTALAVADRLEEPDLICAPDLAMTPSGEVRTAKSLAVLQGILLHPTASTGDVAARRRFVILDSPSDLDPAGVKQYCDGLIDAVRKRGADEVSLGGTGFYYPWISVPRAVPAGERAATGEKVDAVMVPPCGHIAGVFARTDESVGVRKAPANELLLGVLDLERQLSDDDQDGLFSSSGTSSPGAVNCLRAFPGRGIRIWGSRTLSSGRTWRYINVRRVFITAIRWMEHRVGAMTFEPNNPDLWARIRRELNAYCFQLFRHGALKGAVINEAFYVRCDETTNSRQTREAGVVVAEVGLAAARPYEFIVIRLVRRDEGITFTGASAVSL